MPSVRIVTRLRPCGECEASEEEVRRDASQLGFVLDSTTSQQKAYDCIVSPLLEYFRTKGSCFVFAYGQTGSGKTHTIIAPPASVTMCAVSEPSSLSTQSSVWGLFPRLALQVLEWKKDTPGASVRLGALEIYLERAYDLLRNRVHVPLRALSSKPVPQRLTAVMAKKNDDDGHWKPPAYSAKERMAERNESQEALTDDLSQTFMELTCVDDLVRAARNIECTRASQKHNLNDRSSRSHCIITLEYTHPTFGAGKSNLKDLCLVTTTFTFVDLAGCERVFKSGAGDDATGGARRFHIRGSAEIDIPATRFDEARNVNTSLSALGRVLLSLSNGESHVPFRDAALTVLLRPWLLKCQKAMTVVLTVNCDVSNSNETASTLRFGSVVSRISAAKCRARLQISSSDNPKIETVAQRRKTLEAVVEASQAEMLRLEKLGKGGGLNAEMPAPTQKAFLRNQRLFEEANAEELQAKQRLVEATSCGVSTQAEQRAIAAAKAKAVIYQGLVARQISAGVWLPPSDQFSEHAQRAAEAQREIERLDKLS